MCVYVNVCVHMIFKHTHNIYNEKNVCYWKSILSNPQKYARKWNRKKNFLYFQKIMCTNIHIHIHYTYAAFISTCNNHNNIASIIFFIHIFAKNEKKNFSYFIFVSLFVHLSFPSTQLRNNNLSHERYEKKSSSFHSFIHWYHIKIYINIKIYTYVMMSS